MGSISLNQIFKLSFVILLFVLLGTYQVTAAVVPVGFFADTTEKVLELADYDGVPSTSDWDDYFGIIKLDEPGNEPIPTGFRVWFLDADYKPCGLIDITSAGDYGQLRMYEDDLSTAAIDEGAVAGDLITVYAENISTNEMHEAWFVNESVTFTGDMGSYEQDILVNPESVPEPGTILLLGLGGLVLRRRHRA